MMVSEHIETKRMCLRLVKQIKIEYNSLRNL